MSVTGFEIQEYLVDEKDPEIRAALEAIFPGKKNCFPLNPQRLVFQLKGVPSAISNAFQRVMTEELPGAALHVDVADIAVFQGKEDLPVTRFMPPEPVQKILQNVPLRYGVDAREFDNLTMVLDVRNEGEDDLDVFAGSIKYFRAGKQCLVRPPLLNPTTQIAVLQPKTCIRVNNIRVVESMGRLFTGASTAIRGTQRPLDLEELPESETHEGYQGNAQASGFVESMFVAAPQHHEVSVTVPAALRSSRASKKLPSDACNNLLTRFRVVLGVLEREWSAQEAQSSALDATNNSWVVQASTSEPGGGADAADGILHLHGETFSLVEPIRVELVNAVPDIAYVGCESKPETNAIQLHVRHKCDPAELTTIVIQAVKQLIELFGSLQEQFRRL